MSLFSMNNAPIDENELYEDIGGPWVYQDLLEIVNKKRARKRLTFQEKERLEWLCIYPLELNPEKFDREVAEKFVTVSHCNER